jgi:hypothetical protein
MSKPTDEVDAVNRRLVDPIAIEFEQLWEAELKLVQANGKHGGLTEDDWIAMRSEDARCFGRVDA